MSINIFIKGRFLPSIVTLITLFGDLQLGIKTKSDFKNLTVLTEISENDKAYWQMLPSKFLDLNILAGPAGLEIVSTLEVTQASTVAQKTSLTKTFREYHGYSVGLCDDEVCGIMISFLFGNGEDQCWSAVNRDFFCFLVRLFSRPTENNLREITDLDHRGILHVCKEILLNSWASDKRAFTQVDIIQQFNTVFKAGRPMELRDLLLSEQDLSNKKKVIAEITKAFFKYLQYIGLWDGAGGELKEPLMKLGYSKYLASRPYIEDYGVAIERTMKLCGFCRGREILPLVFLPLANTNQEVPECSHLFNKINLTKDEVASFLSYCINYFKIWTCLSYWSYCRYDMGLIMQFLLKQPLSVLIKEVSDIVINTCYTKRQKEWELHTCLCEWEKSSKEAFHDTARDLYKKTWESLAVFCESLTESHKRQKVRF